jgi:dipeptidase E
MKLFLASEGCDPKTTNKLEEYIGGFSEKKVIYIPTARNGENPFNTWQDSDTWKFLNSSGMDISSLQLEDYKSGVNFKLFEGKDIIWITGGACGYLMYWIRRVGLDLLLPKLLEKMIYVGSSAGSMITGPNLEVAENFSERGAHFIPSLKLVDFDIFPHYDENMLKKIKQNYKGKKLYLLKNGEEIIVEDGKVEVIGEERMIQNV